MLQGHDFVGNDKNPYPSDSDAHGMAVAGIIAASHSVDSLEGLSQNSGLISMDASVKILPIRLFNRGIGRPVSEMAKGISYAWKNGADVISNSWQYGDDIDRPILTAAIDSAYQFGRNGFGCPVIFSSGNLGESQPGIVAYPALLSSCFAVGSVALSDERWDESQYGTELDLEVPSGWICAGGDGIWSLDQMGNQGYNPTLTEICSSPAS